MAEQRAQGIAPLALGDKSAGSNPVLPWYMTSEDGDTSSKISSENRRKEIEEKLRAESTHLRELKRKRREDPMKDFIKYQKVGQHEKSSSGSKLSNNDSSFPISNSNGRSKDEDIDLAMLRKKRLDRETTERRKASVLLADPKVNERYRQENKHWSI